jgi:hypothetical protein
LTNCGAHLVGGELRALGPLLPVSVEDAKQAVMRVVAERGEGAQGVLVVLVAEVEQDGRVVLST